MRAQKSRDAARPSPDSAEVWRGVYRERELYELSLYMLNADRINNECEDFIGLGIVPFASAARPTNKTFVGDTVNTSWLQRDSAIDYSSRCKRDSLSILFHSL